MRPYWRPEKVSTVSSPKLKLRLALGMGCLTGSCLAVDSNTGILAYPASGVTVLLDIVNSKQRGYIHQAQQTISCVKFSPDGSLLLIGELGFMPPLRVWNVQQECEVTKFLGHEYGIVGASFSKDMDIVVSVGTRHDSFINVWGWPQKNRLSCNRFAEDIFALCFSTKESYFVTCGVHHIKFWYPVAAKKEPNRYFPLRPRLSTLYGRPAILTDIKNSVFVDIACGSESSGDFTYTVTKCGIVCKLSAGREVLAYKRLQNTQLSSLQVHDEQLMVGSISGHVYFFNALSLEFIATVALPLDICFAEQVIRSQKSSLEAIVDQHKANIFLALDHTHHLLTAALTNGSLCIWDIRDLANIKQKYYSVNHSKSIAGLDLMKGNNSNLNQETIVTVSHDATVRLWEIAMSKGICCKSSKTIYTEFDCVEPSVEESLALNDGLPAEAEEKLLTAIKISPENDYIVTGDSMGCISVYSTVSLENIKNIHKHTRGVTTLNITTGSHLKLRLLTSGGRDRVINIFDMVHDFTLLSTLNIHSSSINSIGLLLAGDTMSLFSSSLDRSLVICKSRLKEVPRFKPFRCRHTACSVTEIVVCVQEGMIAVGRINGELSIIDGVSCKEIKRLNVCITENARLKKIHLEPSKNLVLSACSDMSINVLSLSHGLLLATVNGHTKSISGLSISRNMKFIISTSKDGCVFIWGLPNKLWQSGNKYGLYCNTNVAVSKSDSRISQRNAIQLPDLEITNQPTLLDYISSVKAKMKRIVTVETEKAAGLSYVDDEESSEGFVEEFSVAEDRSSMKSDGRQSRRHSNPCTSDTRLLQKNVADIKFNRASYDSGNGEYYDFANHAENKTLKNPSYPPCSAHEAGDLDQEIKPLNEISLKANNA
ncbi:mitogen-activated protein kinase-binding protein 1-like [Physella acuta]|uniref:mitogen-activated protein kinase-binding protein 1-like n=1 Tax=Physella acuta TaxID=109671 RepID=UPI0027DCEA25|nr:mitogen-activated protein kinase-binding protein 1-like [Physella acuta]XP_059165669.1 mitogen-activated protein kinase-binding protein 1-like [Physella acuta]